MSYPQPFDAVIVWKVDRLARRVLDFLHVAEALQERGAGLVCVDDPIDMTTPQGRAFATVLAVFGELEAAAISARVKSARLHLLKSGRVVGGTVPYGWRSVPSPDGVGLVLCQDPDRIQWVSGMVERAMQGHSVYAIQQWLNHSEAPLPAASQANRRRTGWSYTTVERLLRNPILAGMTAYKPGRGRHDPSDPTALLRDEHGMPVVNDSIAIISPEERGALLSALDGRSSPQSRSRASQGVTTPLLSGLVSCFHCERVMHRGTTQGRPSLSCPECHQTISRPQLDDYLTKRLLSERGDLWVLESAPISTASNLKQLEVAIRDLTSQLADDHADETTLINQIRALKAERANARAAVGPPQWKVTPHTVRRAWALADDNDVERRSILAQQLRSLSVRRGKVGRYLDQSRVVVTWRSVTEVSPFRFRVADPSDGQ